MRLVDYSKPGAHRIRIGKRVAEITERDLADGEHVILAGPAVTTATPEPGREWTHRVCRPAQTERR